MTLLLLWACSGIPEEIPHNAGKVTEAEVPMLQSIASPDLPYMVWLTAAQLVGEDWRTCPKVYLAGASMTAIGQDCVDGFGITWTGTLNYQASGDAWVITASDFGPTGVEGGWIATGQEMITPSSSGSGVLIDTRLEVQSWDGDPIVWWVDTQMYLGEYGGIAYADRYLGTVGLEAWGLADVDGRAVTLAVPAGCSYANHGAGTLTLTGSNEVEYQFTHAVDDTSGPPTPDTAGGETGFIETGDSPSDSDTDTDSGGGDSGDGTPTPEITDNGEVCGVCTTAALDGTALAGCVVPERAMAFAFPSPY